MMGADHTPESATNADLSADTRIQLQNTHRFECLESRISRHSLVHVDPQAVERQLLVPVGQVLEPPVLSRRV